MVGWRTARAGRMEDGKERDPNQSSCKMDGAERYGEEEGKEEGRCSIGVEVLRGMEEEGEDLGL